MRILGIDQPIIVLLPTRTSCGWYHNITCFGFGLVSSTLGIKPRACYILGKYITSLLSYMPSLYDAFL